jgi:molybdopterin molybdotransferase
LEEENAINMLEKKAELLPVNEALRRLLDRFVPVSTEFLSISDALGRILAQDIVSEADLPYFTNSSMDGFAVKAVDVASASPATPVILKIIEDISAGSYPIHSLNSNEAARIMTGAPLPEGADAVVPVEYTNLKMERTGLVSQKFMDLIVYKPVKEGDFIRQKGDDFRKGKIILKQGLRLRPQELGLLAMLGIIQIPVFKRPKIATFSTGDELLPLAESLTPGKIHDSNSYTLSAQIQRDGGETIYLGIVPDQVKAVQDSLQTAIEAKVDLILSSAGVSVGAFDFVRLVIEMNGKLDFWRVNMRPGKPITFGEYGNIPFIGLPGNPVSAFVGYEVFVRPAVMKLSGLLNFQRFRIKVKLKEDLESDGRESYLRAIIEEVDGEWIATLTGHQGSGNLVSLAQANALLIIPSGVKSLPSSTEVDAWLISE